MKWGVAPGVALFSMLTGLLMVACSSTPEGPDRQVLETPTDEEEVVEAQIWDDDPEIHLAKIEEEFEEWAAVVIEGSEEEQDEATREMVQGFRQLVVEYQQLFEHGEPTSMTAGLYRIGDMQHRMSRALFEAPIPFEEGSEEYREEKQDRFDEAERLEKRAVDHFEEMLWTAADRGIRTEWIGRAVEELKRHDPMMVESWLDEFPEQVQFVAEQYQWRCEEGQGWACAALARLYGDEDRLGDDPHAALKLYESACELDAEECLELGVIYADGQGVDADEERAEELFEVACDAGSLKACELVEE